MTYEQISKNYGIDTSISDFDHNRDYDNNSCGCWYKLGNVTVSFGYNDYQGAAKALYTSHCISLLPELIKATEETITWFGYKAELKSLNEVLNKMKGCE